MNLNKLKGKLVEHGKTYQNCAEATGISATSFNSKMNGKSRFYIDGLVKLGDFIGMTVEEKVDVFYRKHFTMIYLSRYGRRVCMVRIFINGEQVKEEDICKHEITNEKVKKIVADALARKEREGA